jgi:hypothetical protein
MQTCLRCGKTGENPDFPTYIPRGWIMIEQNAPPVAWSGYFCSARCALIHFIGRAIIQKIRKFIGLYREHGDCQL